MKVFGKLIVIVILSFAIATGLFFVNSDVIVSSWQDNIAEITFLALPVFIVVALLYFVNRALVKTVKGLRKKKPSGGEGFNN